MNYLKRFNLIVCGLLLVHTHGVGCMTLYPSPWNWIIAVLGGLIIAVLSVGFYLFVMEHE